uniref:Secreted protein n=1 Tax=Romanomermis culicivorax TaxID=13658 RepID=A0A915IZP6_ROMCU
MIMLRLCILCLVIFVSACAGAPSNSGRSKNSQNAMAMVRRRTTTQIPTTTPSDEYIYPEDDDAEDEAIMDESISAPTKTVSGQPRRFATLERPTHRRN